MTQLETIVSELKEVINLQNYEGMFDDIKDPQLRENEITFTLLENLKEVAGNMLRSL